MTNDKSLTQLSSKNLKRIQNGRISDECADASACTAVLPYPIPERDNADVKDNSLVSCVYSSPIGNLLIVSNGQAIVSCQVYEGSDEELETLQHTEAADPALVQCIQELDEYFDGKRTVFSVPLQIISGTPFQRRVWQEIARIPYGYTRNYSDLAAAAKSPKAYRSVGDACGKNPIMILIPCHRVTGKNNLGGFSCGLDRKLILMQHEGIILA